MPQKISPFVEGKYGWNYGEDGWNVGMDENIVKFSFLFDGNVNEIVDNLPTAVNGRSYYLTSDRRFYFAVGSTYYSSPVPENFIFKDKSSSKFYQRVSNSVIEVDSPVQVRSRLSELELTKSQLGSAAFQPASAFATPSNVSSALSQANSYTDTQLSPISSRVTTLENTPAQVDRYSSVTPSSGVLTLNYGQANFFGVSVAQNITSTVVTNIPANQPVVINLIFSQGATGYSVVLPTGTLLPAGVTNPIETGSNQVTLGRLVSVDAGVTWYYTKLSNYSLTPASAFVLPSVADENSTFNDEGTSTTGWSNSNSTLAISSSYLRQTKTTAGTNSSMSKTITTFTPSNSDFILYGKTRVKYASDTSAVIWLLNGSKEISIWFGTAAANSSNTLGAISICGTTGSSTRNVAQVASGINYETTPIEFALQFDFKFSTLTCWFRETDGRWKWKGRVACNWFSSPDIQLLTTSASAAGSWIEFDYLTLARPNIAVLSDSIGEGKTLFSPDPVLDLTNDESTWMRHAKIYQSMRNNLVVNKGVGGNTSAQMLSRVADVTSTGARVVFLHSSTNDVVGGISQSTRTSNIQNTVNAITSGGGTTVLLNAMCGTSTAPDNSSNALRDYMRTWWTNSSAGITGVSTRIDIMTPIKVTNDYMNPTLTQADGLHPNVSGHQAIGQYIAS